MERLIPEVRDVIRTLEIRKNRLHEVSHFKYYVEFSSVQFIYFTKCNKVQHYIYNQNLQNMQKEGTKIQIIYKNQI